MTARIANPKTKNSLLNAAEDLILQKGYAATSVDDICRRAKLTKGSFFHYFKSKEDLGKNLLQRFCCSSQEKMEQCECLSDREADPLKRVYAHVDFVIEGLREPNSPQGCLLGTLAQELSDTHPQIRSLCEEGFVAWINVFQQDLNLAKKKYKPKVDFDSKELAEHFVAIVEGSQILAKLRRDRKVIERNMLHFKQYLKSIFGK